MKTVNVICAGKDGVGKSYLTGLAYLKLKNYEDVLFYDLDLDPYIYRSLPKEKVRRLDFYQGSRFNNYNGETFFNLFDEASKSKQTYFIADTGQRESYEIVRLMNHAYSAEEIKLELDLLKIKLHFHVVMSSERGALKYFNELKQAINGNFGITVWINKGSFYDLEDPRIKEFYRLRSENIKVETFASSLKPDTNGLLTEVLNGRKDIFSNLIFKKLLDEFSIWSFGIRTNIESYVP